MGTIIVVVARQRMNDTHADATRSARGNPMSRRRTCLAERRADAFSALHAVRRSLTLIYRKRDHVCSSGDSTVRLGLQCRQQDAAAKCTACNFTMDRQSASDPEG